MSIGAAPFGEVKFNEVHGRRMAYADIGEGQPSFFCTET